MGSSPALPDDRGCVGIAIAATSVTALWTTDGRPLPRAITFAPSATGFAACQQQLRATGVTPAQTLSVLEATGADGIALAVTLHAAADAVAVLNPAPLHSYAQALPRRGQTDALDAQGFVHSAAERKPAPWVPPPPSIMSFDSASWLGRACWRCGNRRAPHAMRWSSGRWWWPPS